MLAFLLNRCVYVLPTAIGVTVICFLLVHLAPGDPLSAIIPENTPPEIVARIRADYGFDKPLPVQYLLWLAHVGIGDFGQSIATRRPVLAEVIPALGNTLKLAGGAIVLGTLLGVLVGTTSAYRAGGGVDRLLSILGIFGISIPQYWLAMVLIIVFAVDFGVLPATGMGEPNSSLFEQMRHILLPTITLMFLPAGIIARAVRTSVGETLRQDFVRALHAIGLRRFRVFLHVAKNATSPVLAIVGLQFAHLLGGSILVETVFSWPGTGSLLHASIFSRDLPVLQATMLLLALIFIGTNLLVDIVQMIIDPRVNVARRRGVSV